MQLLVGTLRLGKYIRLVPHSVVIGFVNGLAIVIFLAQFHMFGHTGNSGFEYYNTNKLLIMGGLVILTIAIMAGLPKLTKIIRIGIAIYDLLLFIKNSFGFFDLKNLIGFCILQYLQLS